MKLPILTLLFLLCVTSVTVAFSDDTLLVDEYGCSAPASCSGDHEAAGCAGDVGCSGRALRDRGWFLGKRLAERRQAIHEVRSARGCGG